MSTKPIRKDIKQKCLRKEIIATALKMNSLGINQGTSGNVSARGNDGFFITPSGLAYEDCLSADIVYVEMNGHYESTRAPSSEWRFHRDIYAARDDVQAIVHTHSPMATTLACLHRDIPAFHYMVAVAGGKDIRCAPYATFGTQELSDLAVTALEKRRACLLANHGMIATGASLDKALALAVEVESLSGQYWRCLQVGKPHLIDDDEMDRVLELFRNYGQIKGEPLG